MLTKHSLYYSDWIQGQPNREWNSNVGNVFKLHLFEYRNQGQTEALPVKGFNALSQLPTIRHAN